MNWEHYQNPTPIQNMGNGTKKIDHEMLAFAKHLQTEPYKIKTLNNHQTFLTLKWQCKSWAHQFDSMLAFLLQVSIDFDTYCRQIRHEYASVLHSYKPIM